MREKDGKYYAATGTKGYRWKEAELVETLHLEDEIDRGYFDALANDAKAAVEEYEDFERFTGEAMDIPNPANSVPPWCTPCGDMKYKTCLDCPHWSHEFGQCVDESYRCDKNYEVNV